MKPKAELDYSWLKYEKVWWECAECGDYFETEKEADMCWQTDCWPEDARDFMHQGLVKIEGLG